MSPDDWQNPPRHLNPTRRHDGGWDLMPYGRGMDLGMARGFAGLLWAIPVVPAIIAGLATGDLGALGWSGLLVFAGWTVAAYVFYLWSLLGSDRLIVQLTPDGVRCGDAWLPSSDIAEVWIEQHVAVVPAGYAMQPDGHWGWREERRTFTSQVCVGRNDGTPVLIVSGFARDEQVQWLRDAIAHLADAEREAEHFDPEQMHEHLRSMQGRESSRGTSCIP